MCSYYCLISHLFIPKWLRISLWWPCHKYILHSLLRTTGDLVLIMVPVQYYNKGFPFSGQLPHVYLSLCISNERYNFWFVTICVSSNTFPPTSCLLVFTWIYVYFSALFISNEKLNISFDNICMLYIFSTVHIRVCLHMLSRPLVRLPYCILLRICLFIFTLITIKF